MRKPFGKLMLEVRRADDTKTLGQIAEDLGETVDRICDAMDADKILRGDPAYIDGDTGRFVYVDPVFKNRNRR